MYKYCVTISTINTFLLLLLNSVWLLLDLLLSSSLLTIYIIITITITIIITIIIIIINAVIIIVIIKITISSNLIGSFSTLFFLDLTSRECPITKCCY